jgi:hypothetical protein
MKTMMRGKEWETRGEKQGAGGNKRDENKDGENYGIMCNGR